MRSELRFTNPKTKEDDIIYEMMGCPLSSWVDSIMSDKTLLPLCQFDAVRVDQYDGNTFDRRYNEPWTGEAWWEAQVQYSRYSLFVNVTDRHGCNLQSKLPDDAGIFAIILHANKTKLSTFGTQKGYPIYARCGNLPLRVRNSVKHGKEILAGLMPVVSIDHCIVQRSGLD